MSEKLIDVTQPHTIDVEFDYANPPEGGWTPETVIAHLVRSGVPLFSVSDEQIDRIVEALKQGPTSGGNA